MEHIFLDWTVQILDQAKEEKSSNNAKQEENVVKQEDYLFRPFYFKLP